MRFTSNNEIADRSQSAAAKFPILCLHGHPGSGSSMSVFTQHLEGRFLTIAPDLRGYGRNPVSLRNRVSWVSYGRNPVSLRNRVSWVSFEMRDHLTDLEALLDRLQIEKCLVLGWSLGGILALELALKLPEKITGLILIATAARPWSSHPPISWQDNFYTGLASIINRIQPGGQWNIDTFGKRSLYRYLLAQQTPQAYRYLAYEALPAYLQTSAAATRALNTALKSGYNRLPDLQHIKCPSLVLAGECDRHITPESSLETARHLNDSEYRVYPNTAHLFPWEIPDLVLSDIDNWLSRHPRASQ